MTFTLLQNLATKLGLTAHEVLVLYAYTRIGLNRWGTALTLRTLNKVIFKFALKDSYFEQSYGQQLAAKGILSEIEGAFLDGQETSSLEVRADQSSPGPGPRGDRDLEAPQSESDPGVPCQGPTKSKRGRKAKKNPSKRSPRATVSA